MYPFEDHLEVKYAQVTPLVCVVKVRLIQCIFFINSQSVLYSFYIFYPNPLENTCKIFGGVSKLQAK